MANPTLAPLVDGETRTKRVGGALIRLQCVRPDAAYRLAVCYGSTGAEVNELSKSFHSETQARRAARMATTLLQAGFTIQQLVDAVTLFAPTI